MSWIPYFQGVIITTKHVHEMSVLGGETSMILACGSLSSLACWQLLIIRGLARAFLACGKVWGLEPHEQFRGLHVSARGSVNLFSTQLKLSRGRRNHASCSADDEGLFAGISMHPNPCTWLTFRATSRLTRTSRRLTLASVRLPIKCYSLSSAINLYEVRIDCGWNSP